MQILKVIAALMSYPTAELQQAAPALAGMLQQESQLSTAQREQLLQFLERLGTEDLIELQQEYVDTFDRGRACALHLFEHVHGDSRDRGQAMVDLVDVYREAGYTIAVAELPDYLPLFLEFLSTRLAADASSWLAQVEHIIKLLYVRLQDRGSRYAVLFSPLLSIAGVVIQPDERQALIGERDDTPEALDAAWAEEPVTFGLGAEACPSSQPQQSVFPVRWPERAKA